MIYLKKTVIITLGILLLSLTVGCGNAQEHKEFNNSTPSEHSSLANESESIITSWNRNKGGEYSGWLCGLVTKENGSDLVIVNPETLEPQMIKYLDEVSSNQANAISPDGQKIAYSQFITLVATQGTYLIVENLKTGELMEFFDKSDGNQLIGDVQWLSDNTSLLIKMSIKEGAYYTDVLCVLDTDTGKMTLLDRGKFSYGNKILDDERKIYYLGCTQNEFDKMIAKYGGTNFVPVEENGGWNNVEFSNPSISPDGKKVLYSVTLYRNTTPVFDESNVVKPHLWLASGIWVVDIDGRSDPYLIWGNDDLQSNIGKAIWTNDPNIVLFTRYFNELSRGSNHIERLNINSKDCEILVNMTDALETNIPRFSNMNSLFFVADGNEGDKNMIYNFSTEQAIEKKIVYDKKEIKLWRFNVII